MNTEFSPSKRCVSVFGYKNMQTASRTCSGYLNGTHTDCACIRAFGAVKLWFMTSYAWRDFHAKNQSYGWKSFTGCILLVMGRRGTLIFHTNSLCRAWLFELFLGKPFRNQHWRFRFPLTRTRFRNMFWRHYITNTCTIPGMCVYSTIALNGCVIL